MTSVTTTPYATIKATEDDNKSDVTVIVTIITVLLFVVVLTAIIIISVGLLYKRRYHTRRVANFDDQHGS